MISIDIELDPEGPVLDENAARMICRHTLKREGIQKGGITIIFGSDTLLSDLKKTYFNVDQLTDVIAFRLNDYSEPDVEGEIYISLPRALENAREFGEDRNREVARLIIHGSLHLLNHSDETEADRTAMRNLEDACLEQVAWNNLVLKDSE